MCFVNHDGGALRAQQQRQLAGLVSSLLDSGDDEGGPGNSTSRKRTSADGPVDGNTYNVHSGGGGGDGRARSVIVAGDFNHCLASQTVDSSDGAPLQKGPPTNYAGPFLPSHASIDGLLVAMACGGKLVVHRFSTNTCVCPHRFTTRVVRVPSRPPASIFVVSPHVFAGVATCLPDDASTSLPLLLHLHDNCCTNPTPLPLLHQPHPTTAVAPAWLLLLIQFVCCCCSNLLISVAKFNLFVGMFSFPITRCQKQKQKCVCH
jgi:hypothetical protein